MNLHIYLNNKNINILKEIINKANKDNSYHNYHLYLEENIAYSKLMRILKKAKKLGEILITSPVDFLNLSNLNYLLKKKLIRPKISFIISKKITLKEKKYLSKLSSINTSILIEDKIGGLDDNYLKTNRHLLRITPSNDELIRNEIFSLVCKGSNKNSCFFSSCLGKNLVFKNGNIYFCPHHLNGSLLCSCSNDIDFSNIFNNEDLKNVLISTLKTRNQCKETCKHFNLCKGGCPLDLKLCGKFKLLYPEIKLMKDNIISTPVSLDSLTLFKEECIIWEISSLKDISED